MNVKPNYIKDRVGMPGKIVTHVLTVNVASGFMCVSGSFTPETAVRVLP